MGSLADAFPDDIRNQYAESQIECGSVIFLRDPIAGKHKFHVIVGFDGERVLAATVRINSEINENIYNTPEKRSMCHPVSPDTLPFLDHDSFIPCDQIIEWNRKVIVSLIKSDSSIVLGVLPIDELEIVQLKIATAPTISLRTKRKFGLVFE